MLSTNSNVKGQKKSLSDVVALVAIKETPFVSAIKNEKVQNVLHNWVEEELNAVSATGVVEGADAGTESDQVLTERDNYAQLFEKVVKVSSTHQATAQAGGLQSL